MFISVVLTFTVKITCEFYWLVGEKFNVLLFFIALGKFRVAVWYNVPLLVMGSWPDWEMGAKLWLMEVPYNPFVSLL